MTPARPQRGLEEGQTAYLVHAVASGERERAWRLLSQKCLHYLGSRFGRSSLPRTLELDDFVNEVMLKILTSIDSFEDRGKDSFWKWVQTVAGNQWRDIWRKFHREQRLGLVGAGGGSADASGVSSPLDAAASRDHSPTQIAQFQQLESVEQDCLQRLPSAWRDVYVMRRQFELSFAEVAKRTGVMNEATLRSHYKRAREKMRECLLAKVDALGAEFDGWS